MNNFFPQLSLNFLGIRFSTVLMMKQYVLLTKYKKKHNHLQTHIRNEISQWCVFASQFKKIKFKLSKNVKISL